MNFRLMEDFTIQTGVGSLETPSSAGTIIILHSIFTYFFLSRAIHSGAICAPQPQTTKVITAYIFLRYSSLAVHAGNFCF